MSSLCVITEFVTYSFGKDDHGKMGIFSVITWGLQWISTVSSPSHLRLMIKHIWMYYGTKEKTVLTIGKII